MRFCDYGCGQEAKYQFKNGKWCCSSNHIMCPILKEKVRKNVTGSGNPRYGTKCTDKTIEKIRKTLKGMMCGSENPFYKKTHSLESKKKMSQKLMYSINDYKRKYPTFCKEEEMRYDPDKSGEKEIQVHCKNHNCENSKEKDGWFTPTKLQSYERIRQLESKEGNGGNYFYCSQKCKDECPLYNLRGDPFRNTDLPYTPGELQTFRTFVLERDTYICQFCGDPATCVHHEKPQKLEPFFSLDPDYAWSCCEKCHYKKGHQDECSTGNLAKIVCRNRGDRFI